MTKWTREKIEEAYTEGRRDFSGEDFSDLDLHGIILSRANLVHVDLSGADLIGADMSGATLIGANLTGASLMEADLTEADLDYSSCTLWCGSLDVRVDERIAAQLMYHVLNVMSYSGIKIPNTRDELIDFANKMHRTDVKRVE